MQDTTGCSICSETRKMAQKVQVISCKNIYPSMVRLTPRNHGLVLVLIIQMLRDYSERYGGRKIWFTEFAVAREHDENTIIQYIQVGQSSQGNIQLFNTEKHETARCRKLRPLHWSRLYILSSQELLPLLEHSDFIHKYSWFISRYYEVSGSV